MKLKEKDNILMNLANHTEKSVLMPENPVTLDNPDGIYLYRGRIFANNELTFLSGNLNFGRCKTSLYSIRMSSL